jgi:hypothetical protein
MGFESGGSLHELPRAPVLEIRAKLAALAPYFPRTVPASLRLSASKFIYLF